jgi:hypothetical protein
VQSLESLKNVLPVLRPNTDSIVGDFNYPIVALPPCTQMHHRLHSRAGVLKAVANQVLQDLSELCLIANR